LDEDDTIPPCPVEKPEDGQVNSKLGAVGAGNVPTEIRFTISFALQRFTVSSSDLGDVAIGRRPVGLGPGMSNLNFSLFPVAVAPLLLERFIVMLLTLSHSHPPNSPSSPPLVFSIVLGGVLYRSKGFLESLISYKVPFQRSVRLSPPSPSAVRMAMGIQNILGPA
jgi:hypothetical protein